MLALARFVGEPSGGSDVSAEIFQFLAHGRTLGQLVGKAKFAGVQASVERRDEDGLGHVPTAVASASYFTAGGDGDANGSQSGVVEQVGHGSAHTRFIDD